MINILLKLLTLFKDIYEKKSLSVHLRDRKYLIKNDTCTTKAFSKTLALMFSFGNVYHYTSFIQQATCILSIKQIFSRGNIMVQTSVFSNKKKPQNFI